MILQLILNFIAPFICLLVAIVIIIGDNFIVYISYNIRLWFMKRSFIIKELRFLFNNNTW